MEIQINYYDILGNPNSFNESNNDEDDNRPKSLKVSCTIFSKIFLVTVRVSNIISYFIAFLKLLLKIKRPGVVSIKRFVIS